MWCCRRQIIQLAVVAKAESLSRFKGIGIDDEVPRSATVRERLAMKMNQRARRQVYGPHFVMPQEIALPPF